MNLAKKEEHQDLSNRQLIIDTYCKGATPQESELFLEVCKRTGLDPVKKQIYAIKRWDSDLRREVMQTQTSIDGFRLIAARSKKYCGQVGPYWCGDDGKWKEVWLSPVPPSAAKVGVLHCDFKEPVWGIATYNSYAQRKKDGSVFKIWGKMPDVMLAKCAESLALRKAFPEILSGIYSEEEMSQASDEKTTRVQKEKHTEADTKDPKQLMLEKIEVSSTEEALKTAFSEAHKHARYMKDADFMKEATALKDKKKSELFFEDEVKNEEDQDNATIQD